MPPTKFTKKAVTVGVKAATKGTVIKAAKATGAKGKAAKSRAKGNTRTSARSRTVADQVLSSSSDEEGSEDGEEEEFFDSLSEPEGKSEHEGRSHMDELPRKMPAPPPARTREMTPPARTMRPNATPASASVPSRKYHLYIYIYKYHFVYNWIRVLGLSVPDVITLLETVLKEVNSRFSSLKRVAFFTEVKIGFLEVLWPTSSNVKPVHRQFVLNQDDRGIKLGMELFSKLQMATYFLYPDANLNYRARDEVELALKYLLTVSKTYSSSVAQKGITMFHITSECYLYYLCVLFIMTLKIF